MTQIQEKSITDLKPYPQNPRVHSEEQVDRIARSIEEFGWTNPVLISKDNEVIAGHGRLEAAKKMGLEKVPTLTLSSLTKDQARAYIIADNQTALVSSWDDELLELELEALEAVDFDLTVLGWGDDLPQFVEMPDYSILEGEDVDDLLDELEGGAKRGIQIEFKPEDYPRAIEALKYWRQRAYVGGMILAFLELKMEGAE